jgi:hypothetical protein
MLTQTEQVDSVGLLLVLTRFSCFDGVRFLQKGAAAAANARHNFNVKSTNRPTAHSRCDGMHTLHDYYSRSVSGKRHLEPPEKQCQPLAVLLTFVRHSRCLQTAVFVSKHSFFDILTMYLRASWWALR